VTLAIGAAAVILAVIVLIGPKVQPKVDVDQEPEAEQPKPIRHGINRSRLS
jgi:hypothetical protein